MNRNSRKGKQRQRRDGNHKSQTIKRVLITEEQAITIMSEKTPSRDFIEKRDFTVKFQISNNL